jgi:hypothetical protein
MTQRLFDAAPILNVPILIREGETSHRKQDHRNEDEDDDLIFGALDDEDSPQNRSNDKSSSIDEGIHFRSSIERSKKRERTYSSISAVDDDWENILPITEGDGPLNSINHLQSINEKSSTEQIIGMSNFRAKHRLRRRSQTTSLVRWKDAVKKVVQLKDPW